MSVEPIIHQCESEICKAGMEVEIIQIHQRINLFLSRLNEPQKCRYATALSEDADSPSVPSQLFSFFATDHEQADDGQLPGLLNEC